MRTTILLTASALALTLFGAPYAMAATDSDEHAAHHPEAETAAEQPGAPLAAKMQAMRDQVAAIRDAETAEERKRLIDEHMTSLDQMQSMMQGMMGRGGGMMMGPGMMGNKSGAMMGPGMMGNRSGGMMGPGMMGNRSVGAMAPGMMMSPQGSGAGGPPCPMMDSAQRMPQGTGMAPGMGRGMSPGMGRGMGMMSPERRMDMMEQRMDMMQTMMEQMEWMMQQGGYGTR